jgi:hypothetical protein
MTQDAQPQDAAPAAAGGTRPRLGTELIDVLLRGLVEVRDRVTSEGELEPDSLVCAGLYYDGHHYCPLLYLN